MEEEKEQDLLLQWAVWQGRCMPSFSFQNFSPLVVLLLPLRLPLSPPRLVFISFLLGFKPLDPSFLLIRNEATTAAPTLDFELYYFR